MKVRVFIFQIVQDAIEYWKIINKLWKIQWNLLNSTKKILKDYLSVGNVFVKSGKMSPHRKKFIMEFRKWVKVSKKK